MSGLFIAVCLTIRARETVTTYAKGGENEVRGKWRYARASGCEECRLEFCIEWEKERGAVVLRWRVICFR